MTVTGRHNRVRTRPHSAGTRRVARLVAVALLASSGAAVSLGTAGSALAATNGTALSMTGSMEGPLAIAPGSWVAGGYHFSGGTPGAGVDFERAQLTLAVSCSKGGTPLPTPITVPMAPGPWTPDGVDAVPWDDLRPENNDSPADAQTFQGATRAPDLCAGGAMHNTSGALFTAALVSQSATPISVEFHYRVPSATGKPNVNCVDRNSPGSAHASVCGAALSAAKTFTPTPINGGLSGLTMTTSTPREPAGHGTVPLGAIPASALLGSATNLVGAPGFGTPGFGTPGFGTPGFGTPGFGTPGFGTPGFGTPGFGTPGFGTPLGDSVLSDPALGVLSLAQVPIVATDGSAATTWDTVLAGTALAGLPTQTITLAEVLALTPRPASVSALTLGQLDLSGTDLRRSSLGAYLLGGTPLRALPVPLGSTSWCASLAGQPYSCSTHPDALDRSLLAAELGGATFGSYYAGTAIELVGLPLTRSPLTYLLLNNIDLSLTSLGGTRTTALTTPTLFVSCTPSATPSSCDTLAQAQKSGDLKTTGTLGGLLADSGPAVQSLALADLLGGTIARQNLPIENVPTATIIASSPMPASGAAYRISVTLTCSQTAGLVIAPALPEGFRIIPATVKATLGTGADVPVNVSDVGTITPKNAVTCSGTQPLAVDLQAEPSTILGPTTAGATVAVTGGSVSVTGTAPVEVTKNFIVGNTANPANPAVINTVYVGHIASPGDIDYFSVPALPAGSKLTVTLSHLANDNDLVVYGPGAPLLRATPGFGTPGFGTPGFGTPGFGTPGFGTPGFGTPGFGTPGFGTAATDASTSFASDGTQASPSLDPDIPRLKLPVRGFSHQRGLTTETVTTTVLPSDTSPFLLQVSGYLDANNAAPYVLRVSATPPPAAAPCAPRNYPHAGRAGTLPSTPLDPATQTLILVNQQRLGAIYGPINDDSQSGDAGELIAARLQGLSGEASVKGVVVPVEGDSTVRDAYAAWDADVCNPAAANSVVAAMNALVDRLRTGLPDLRNVVVVGIDDVVPYARVTDLTAAYNESQYSQLMYDGVANAQSAAARAGFLLTDNPYGDLAPQPYLDRQLYVPQLAVGRLVETPADILGQIASYRAAGGRTNPTSSFVTGYSPLDKGARAVAASLAGKPGVTANASQINSTWTRQDAIAGLAGAASGYGAVNAHYDVYRALPGNEDESDPLTTADLPPSLQGSVQFTIGCHSGLSVPDIYVATPGAEQRDWPQAMLGRGASAYVGNTGYGLGDTDALAYSEKMSALFAEHIGPTMTLGQAMSFAKQAYVATVGSPSVYDAKVVEQTTFYGLPMWRIGAAGVSAKATLPAPATAGPSTITLAATPVSTPITTTKVTAASGRGTYYGVDTHAPLVVPGQPVQPLTAVTLPVRNDGLVAHGAITEGLSSYDVAGVDPVYSTPIVDSAETDPEPAVGTSFFPSRLQHVAGTVTPAGRQDSLSLVAGQFATDGSGTGKGTQRLFTQIDSTVLLSDSTDFSPPRLTGVNAAIQGSVARFTVTTPDPDAARAVVLMLVQGGPEVQTWQHVELVNAGGGQWVGTVVLPAGTTSIGHYAAEVADTSGNVARSSNKGQNFSAAPVAGLQVSVSPAADPRTGIYVAPVTVTLGGTGSGATYRLDGADPQPYTGPVTVTGEGGHTFTAVSATGQAITLGLPIDDQAPVVTVTGPTEGASYPHDTRVSATVSCSSAVTLLSCYGPPALDTSAVGSRTYQAVGQDVFGRTTTRSVRYTVTNAAPTVVLTRAPTDGTTSTDELVTYRLADADDPVDGLTTSCTLNGEATACDAGSAQLSGLTPGTTPYVFVVTVRDGFGGVGTATATWRVFQATRTEADPVIATLPNVSATLSTAGGPLAGRTLAFYQGNAATRGPLLCSASTDASGKAACGGLAAAAAAAQAGGVTAVFTAVAPFAGSEGRAGTVAR